jgi:MbtH protein
MMTETDSHDDPTFQVVVNHEEQYSIWQEGRELPLGWKPVGYTGTKEACLDHVEEIWTDITPLSVRQALARQKAQ